MVITWKFLFPSSTLSTTTLFDEIDNCIDESLISLRSHFFQMNHNSKHKKHDTTHDHHNDNTNSDTNTKTFQIVSIGISSFVMNFIGIDSKGDLINEESTLSYACNSIEVSKDCTRLKHELGDCDSNGDDNGNNNNNDDNNGSGKHKRQTGRLYDLYQRTGTPLHNAYALPQLRVYYNQHPSNNTNEQNPTSSPATPVIADHWTTISSYCITRWTGQWDNLKTMPISYSEASWTGLFNFRTCQWDDLCLELLPVDCIESLPLVSDLNGDASDAGDAEHYFEIDEKGSESILGTMARIAWKK